MASIMDYPRVPINFNPPVPPLKKIEDKTKIDVRYSVLSPYVVIHIHWDPSIYEVVYEVEEPRLSPEEEDIREQILIALRDMIDFDAVVKKDTESLLEYIDKKLKIIAFELGLKISYDTYKKVYYYLVRDFLGFNDIDPLLRDYFAEDIECNGANSPVYVVHRIFRNLKTNIIFRDMNQLENFIEKLAQRSGKHISYASPILDGTLPDGSRINATYTEDITSKGPTFTIRKFTKTPWTPSQLISFRTLSPEMLAYLWMLVQYKMNILVAGGTSSGKTTLLNAIAFFIPPESRVVSIEDTRELNLPRENWLPSVARGAIGVGNVGEIDLFTLLKSSFRQNPDYVIVGEVRGKEAYVLFQGMASGHSSLSTMHADSVDTLMKRLETPPIDLSPTLLNVLDCVCIMTHARVQTYETRKLREIVEIINITPEGIALTNTPFIWNPGEDKFYFKKNSKILEKISKRFGITTDELEAEFKRRAKLLYKMYESKTFDFQQFQDLITQYYKKPQEVLNKFQVE